MERNLEVRLIFVDDIAEVQVCELESGDFVRNVFPFEPLEHAEFNEWIGNEIYSWLELMNETLHDESD